MDNENLFERSASEVFEDHLILAQEGRLEEDLRRNCAEDIVLLTNYGTFRGHDGVREAAGLLNRQLPGGNFGYEVKLCHDNMCFLHWTGDSKDSNVADGADSFLIEDGKIKIQTIFYTVHGKKGGKG